MSDAPAEARVARLVQPKPWVRWIAVVLAALGWYVSWHSFRVSSGDVVHDPLMDAVCGGDESEGGNACTSVLQSPQAYIPLGREQSSMRMPSATLGMGYFAVVGLWFLLVGPPTPAGRFWHLLPAILVAGGAGYSVHCIHVMGSVLHQWCGICLTAHVLNGGIVVVTVLAWPWRPAKVVQPAHPSLRLTAATVIAGVLMFITHISLVYVVVAGAIFHHRAAEYAAVLNDPAYIRWDFERQTPIELPIREDEPLAGSADAADTVVVFSDFLCTACRQAAETIPQVLERYPGRLRVAYRHYPQDAECNASPRYRVGGHSMACAAARATEAARVVGGTEAYLAMRKLIYQRQAELPGVPFAEQSAQQRALLADWAVELGLDRAAFETAMASPAVAERIAGDIALAGKMGIHAMPAIYLNGRRLRGWSNLSIWDMLLGAPTSAPATAPAGDPEP
ncbi:MAG: thioredoxin domain-containing protein [Phycisphaerae bacterium]|jgi:protein-disulfide isomerase/uncharacterized membrane protein